MLLNARSGEVLIEQSLEASDRPLLSVIWRTSPDQGLLIRKFEPRAIPAHTVESFPDEANCPLIDGDVYAFHRPSGRPQWSVPAVVEGYGLPLDQPDDVPVLAFVPQISRNSGRSRRPTLSMLCLDKRDGRLLLEAENLNFSYGSFFMSGDPQQRTVSLRLLNVHNYLLTFTDEPQPPEPPAQVGRATNRRKGMLGIMGAVFDAVGRQLEGLNPKPDDEEDPEPEP